MAQPFNEIVYLTLSPEAQEKVYAIYNIASILHHNHVPPLTTKEFDELYDRPVRELQVLVGSIAGHFMGLP
jgi:hypothetical protein